MELKDDRTNGVIIAQGGRFGGWAIFMKDGKPFMSITSMLERYKATAKEAIAAGKHTIVFHFVPDDPKKLGSGGKGVLSVDGKQVAEVLTPRMVYACSHSTMAWASAWMTKPTYRSTYKEGDNEFTGEIDKVTIAPMTRARQNAVAGMNAHLQRRC